MTAPIERWHALLATLSRQVTAMLEQMKKLGTT